MKKTLTLAYTDVCLPDYWGGYSGPFLSVPVHYSQTVAEIKASLAMEYRMDGFYGYETGISDEKEQFKAIIDNLFTVPDDRVNPFDLEEPEDDEDDEDGLESVYLYLMFKVEEEEL